MDTPIYIYIYMSRVLEPPLPVAMVKVPHPSVGVGGLVWGGLCDFSDASELHLSSNITKQIEISDSGLWTFWFWSTWWTWQIIIQIYKCFINILTWDIVQSKYSFSKSTTGAKSPLFRADPEENGSGARNPCWNHRFEWGTPSQGSRPYPWVGGPENWDLTHIYLHIYIYIYIYGAVCIQLVCNDLFACSFESVFFRMWLVATPNQNY